MIDLDERLESSSTFVTDLRLCQVRLSNNAAFPWILLIPKRKEISEIVDLNDIDQQLLMSEIVLASRVMRHIFHPGKLNIAALGNIVPQLHVHIVARYQDDIAWPDPIWNNGIYEIYDEQLKAKRLMRLRDAFDD